MAAEVGHNYSDGAWLVELAPVRQAGEVAEAVLEGLEIAARPGMTGGREHLRSASVRRDADVETATHELGTTVYDGKPRFVAQHLAPSSAFFFTAIANDD